MIAARVEDMRRRRAATGLGSMSFGVAAYAIVRDSEAEAHREVQRITDVKQSAAGYGNYQQWIANTQLEQRLSLEEYSVSNRGLRSGLVGTPEQVITQIRGVRRSRRRPAPSAVQSAIGGNATLRRQVIAPYRAKREPRQPHLSAGEMTGTPG